MVNYIYKDVEFKLIRPTDMKVMREGKMTVKKFNKFLSQQKGHMMIQIMKDGKEIHYGSVHGLRSTHIIFDV